MKRDDLFQAARAYLSSEIAIGFMIVDGFELRIKTGNIISSSLEEEILACDTVKDKIIAMIIDVGKATESENTRDETAGEASGEN